MKRYIIVTHVMSSFNTEDEARKEAAARVAGINGDPELATASSASVCEVIATFTTKLQPVLHVEEFRE